MQKISRCLDNKEVILVITTFIFSYSNMVIVIPILKHKFKNMNVLIVTKQFGASFKFGRINERISTSPSQGSFFPTTLHLIKITYTWVGIGSESPASKYLQQKKRYIWKIVITIIMSSKFQYIILFFETKNIN